MSNKKSSKPNPILAAFEAKLRKEFAEMMAAYKAERDLEFREGMSRADEISCIAFLIAGNDLGIIGTKRAGPLLEDAYEVKEKFCRDLLKDAEDDAELTYTKSTIAKRLKSIMGRESWEKHRELFPLLRDYWEWD